MANDVNGVLVRLAAKVMIEQHGLDAARIARELAASADGVGDQATAYAWRKIAHAIELLQTA
jgi:hypothetical protein